MKTSSLCVGLALATTWSFLSLTSPTAAQELNLGPIIDPGIAGNAAAQRQIAEQEYKRATGRSPHRTSPSKRPSSSASTRYRVDRAARKRRVATWMNKMRTVDAKGIAQFQRQLAGRDLIDFIQPRLSPFGLSTNDVADVLSVYLVSAWYGVRGSNQDPPRAWMLATRNQMRTSLLSNPVFTKASNATKQEVAESLLLQTIEDSSNLDVAKKDPKQMPRVKSMIRQSVLKTFQLDMTKLKLTSQGLRA